MRYYLKKIDNSDLIDIRIRHHFYRHNLDKSTLRKIKMSFIQQIPGYPRFQNIFNNLKINALYFIFMALNWIKLKSIKFMDRLVQFSDCVKQSEIIYFDFETTGLNPYHEKIIDYTFLFEETDSEETYIESLVNPETKFEKVITDITGIHPEELEDKLTIKNHIPTIYHFINANYRKIVHKHVPEIFMVAHNCDGFDKIFLMRLFEDREKYPLVANWKFIDTLPLAKKLLPKLKSHSMKSLCQHFNIKAGTHRAYSDTVALKKVFHELVKMLCGIQRITRSYYLENPQKIIDYYSF